MTATHRPNREAFTAYWKGFEDDAFAWRRLLPYVLYLGPLILYASLMRRLDPEAGFRLPSFVAALG